LSYDYQSGGASGPTSRGKARLKWFNATKGFGFVSPEDGSGDAFLHVSVLHQAGLQVLGDNAEIVCEIGPGQRGPLVTRILEVLDAGSAPAPSGPGGGGMRDRGGYGDRGDRGGYGDRGDRGGYGDRGGGYRDRGDRDGGYGGGGGFRSRDRDRDRGGDDGYQVQGTGPVTEVAGTVKWFKPDKGFGFITPDDQQKDVFVHKSVLRRCGLNDLVSGQRVQMRVQQVDKGREATWISALGE
jgi:CspA family cold shock protein